MKTGKLIISLDFELHWGVFDSKVLDANGRKYFLDTRELIPQVLKRFESMDIRATWATVGILFVKDIKQLRAFLPTKVPVYANSAYSAYGLIEREEVGSDEKSDPFHYAPSLVEKILETRGQELASHTFSHYYCLEPKREGNCFAEDLDAAQAIAKENFGVTLKSLVLPRNQFTPDDIITIGEAGFLNARSNPGVWFWKGESKDDESRPKRTARLLDHYFPLDKDTLFELPLDVRNGVADLPASRLFRPYIANIDGIGGQTLKIRRIQKEMTAAAIQGKCYHLWWHPHNLATDPARNMAALDAILRHFLHLRDRYGMESKTMLDITPAK